MGKKAKEDGIVLVPSNPCVEGLLLEILGQNIPETSKACKRKMLTHFTGDTTIPDSYTQDFSIDVLESRRSLVPSLDVLLFLLSGKKPPV